MPAKTRESERDTAPDPEQLKNLLLVLEHARADAWLRRDRQALEALLAPEFCEINYFGRIGKEDLLARFFPRLFLHTFTIEDPSLRIISGTAASLMYECYEEITVDGKKMKGNYTVSSLYGWNGRQWKLVLWQITPFCGK